MTGNMVTTGNSGVDVGVVYTRRHGRELIIAIGAIGNFEGPPAPFKATGLDCELCWSFLARQQPESTWALARQARMRRIRAVYRAKRR